MSSIIDARYILRYELVETCQRLHGIGYLQSNYYKTVIKETLKNYDMYRALEDNFNDSVKLIDYLWCSSTLYFLFYALNLRRGNYENEIKYLKEKIQSIIRTLNSYDIDLNHEWAEWQFNENGLHKEFPINMTKWCKERLLVFKAFSKEGICTDEHFPFLLYIFMEKAEYHGQSMGTGVPTSCYVSYLSAYCAYAENEEECYENINNFIVNYNYFYILNHNVVEKELDKWPHKYYHLCESNRTHQNYEDILATAFDCDTSMAILMFDVVFRDKPVSIVKIIFRCLGLLFPGNNESESLYIARLFKEISLIESNVLSDYPGLVFCLYWSIRYMKYHDFKNIFLDDEDPTIPENTELNKIIEEGGIISKKKYKGKNSTDLLQMLLFFLVFESSKNFHFPLSSTQNTKECFLRGMIKSVQTKEWTLPEIQLKFFKKLANLCNFSSVPLTLDFSCLAEITLDGNKGFEAAEVGINVIYNNVHYSNSLNQIFLLNQLNFVREQQLKYYPVLAPKNTYSISDSKSLELLNNQQKLKEKIDTGFIIPNLNQIIPPFSNILINRGSITCKLFDEVDNSYSDNRTKCNDFRNHYKNFMTNKYLYKERNMIAHYSDYHPIELLLNERNINNLLYCLCDCEGFISKELTKSNIKDFLLNRISKVRVQLEQQIRSYLEKDENIFDSNDILLITESRLKNIGKSIRYTRDISSEYKSELKELLGIMFNIDGICDLEYNENIRSINFFDKFSSQISMYLIKVTFELQHSKILT